MKADEVRNMLHRQSFQPFVIHMADGGRVPVKHMDFVMLAPSGREIIVYQPDNTWQVLDVPLITRLEVSRRNGARRSKKARKRQ
jgi:hypothetical protein